MSYYFKKTISGTMEAVEGKVRDALKLEGFGVLTEIDVQRVLKEKINEDIGAYKILGACNPQFAHKALLSERNIGLMLPCNVVIQKWEEGVEVSVIDPAASMVSVENEGLEEVATEVQIKLKRVIETLV